VQKTLDQGKRTFIDNATISQVIRNPLSNPIKFSPENNIINIAIESALAIVGNRKADRPIPLTKYEIADNGIGIPKDELKSIFDKFIQSSKTSTGAGGTGLGLAICQQIIRRHRGKIWVEQNPKGGLKLCFYLPEDHY
jgi:signal transduction histidine kinase